MLTSLGKTRGAAEFEHAMHDSLVQAQKLDSFFFLKNL